MSDSLATARVRWYETEFYKSCEKLAVLLRWLVVITVFVGGIYVYQRDVNAAQTIDVRDLKRDQDALKGKVDENDKAVKLAFERLRSEMLTRELYEARHQADLEKLDRIEQQLNRLMARP